MLFEQILDIAKTYPDRIAIAEREADYTYSQLIGHVAQIAEQISSKNPSDRPILVFGKNNFLTLAAMLATNLTGRAYIPVDAHTPFERTQLIFGAAKPSLVIATEPLTDEFATLFAERLDVVTDSSVSSDFDKISTDKAIKGNDSAYIIYTSGTTGVPKGVEVSHDNLVTFTHWMNNDFDHIDQNQILSQALYSFDLSIFSLYPSLTTGGTLVGLSRDETTNFKLLFERLNSTTINTWISTPSFVDICLLDPSFTAEKHPNLTQFIFCGEELTVKTAEKLLKAFPSANIYNTYGPTEATGAISSVKVTAELLANNARVPIGRAKPGVELRIMDKEIIIVGDSVAKGYFENPEKTEQAFFMLDGQPAYHTGDAGDIDADGMLHYQGRIDFQVKFNGFRIELQDIEAHMLALDPVEKAVVLPKYNDQHKVTGLIAILATDATFADRAAERAFTKTLKADLSKTIMDYMMPTKFVYLAEFPLNQNGKIDRKALAAQIVGEN